MGWTGGGWWRWWWYRWGMGLGRTWSVSGCSWWGPGRSQSLLAYTPSFWCPLAIWGGQAAWGGERSLKKTLGPKFWKPSWPQLPASVAEPLNRSVDIVTLPTPPLVGFAQLLVRIRWTGSTGVRPELYITILTYDKNILIIRKTNISQYLSLVIVPQL